MKQVLQAVLFLTLITPSFSATPEVDFDGKNKATKTFSDQLAEATRATQQESLPIPSQPTGNIPSFEMGIVTESGEKIKISPTIDPVTNKTYYKFRPAQNIYWRANCTSSSQGTYTARQTYRFNPSYGGHNHFTGIPPYTYSANGAALPSVSDKTAPYNTPVYWYLKTPDFSTRSEETLQYVAGCNGTYSDIVDIMVDGLMLLPPANEDSMHGGVVYYNLINNPPYSDYHPINHFGQPQTVDLLKQIAWNYYFEFSSAPLFPKLSINDMSLRWGGLFDINANWKPDHITHRYGRQSDVRRQVVDSQGNVILMPANQQKRLIELACKGNVQVLIEGKTGELIDPFTMDDWVRSTAPHFHLRFPKFDTETDTPPDEVPNLSGCAKFLSEQKQ
jgi:hypothetical protein